MPSENAARPIRASAERTRDLVGVVSRIGALVSSDGLALSGDPDELNSRLELGIPADILWLAKHAKRGLERGDYLALRRGGVSSIEAVDATDDSVLMKIVKATAKIESIRKTVDKIKQAC